MEKLFENAAEVIREASQTPLGIAALVAMSVSIVVVFLFRESPSRVKFSAFLVFAAALLVIVFSDQIQFPDGERTPESLLAEVNKSCEPYKSTQIDDEAFNHVGFHSLVESSLPDIYNFVGTYSSGKLYPSITLPARELDLTLLDNELTATCKMGRCLLTETNKKVRKITIAFADASCSQVAFEILKFR